MRSSAASPARRCRSLPLRGQLSDGMARATKRCVFLMASLESVQQKLLLQNQRLDALYAFAQGLALSTIAPPKVCLPSSFLRFL